MLLVRDELRQSSTPGAHAISIGVFDGVHRGHEELISRMLTEGGARRLTGGIVTFHPSPITVLRPDIELSYLSPLEQRVELLRAAGAEFVSVIQFTSELAQVSAREFVGLLVEEVQMRLLVVGEDFALGRAREGNVEQLQIYGEELGFEVIPVPLLREANDHVSSTRVSAALGTGEMAEVEALLGRSYSVRGPVVHGDGRGRTIGFPTLNIGVSPDRALPPNGVYVTRLRLDDGREFAACTNIGTQPTFDGKQRLVETHVLDFEGDLYGAVVTAELLLRLRDEQKFDGIDALVAQIDRDVVSTRAHFANGDTP